MIGDLLSTLAHAQKLDINSIQRAIQSGTIPPYVGIPLLQQKVQQRKEAEALLAGQKQQGQPPIAQQVMEEAKQVTEPQGIAQVAPTPAPNQTFMQQQAESQPEAVQGIESAQSNLPQNFAGGGIVAFADGGSTDDYEDQVQEEQDIADLELAQMLGDAGVGAGARAARGIDRRSGQEPKGSTMFDKALNFIFPHEGGYVNHPNDRGGPTNMGVTQRTLSAYLGRPASVEDVKNLDRATARDIYKTMYWDKIGGDKLDPKTAMLAFDTAVGSGVGKAKEMLAKHGDDPDRFLAAKKQFLADIVRRDPSQRVFHEGWQRRMNNLGAYAQNLAHGGIASLAQGGKVEHYDDGGSAVANFWERDPSEFKNPFAEWSDYFGKTWRKNMAKRNGEQPVVTKGSEEDTPETRSMKWRAGSPYQTTPMGGDKIGSSMPTPEQIRAKPAKEDEPKKVGSTPAPVDSGTSPDLGSDKTAPKADATESGIDQYIKQLMSDREDFKSQREQDKWLGLLSAGLGMMGGTSPFGISNIGRGAMQGLGQYAELAKGTAGEKAALDKALGSALYRKDLMAAQATKQGEYSALKNRELELEQSKLDSLNADRLERLARDIKEKTSAKVLGLMKLDPTIIAQSPQLSQKYQQNLDNYLRQDKQYQDIQRRLGYSTDTGTSPDISGFKLVK